MHCQACLVAASAVRPVGVRADERTGDLPPEAQRPLIVTGAIAACVVTAAGISVITVPILAAWIAAPHAGLSLLDVLRAVAVLWLAGQHVAIALPGAGRIGMLPLGLALLPGALLWRAGRWVVRTAHLTRLRHAAYAALALALPYCVLTGGLAVASRSSLASASVLQAVACALLLALAAGGLGAARAVAPWPKLVTLLPHRERSVLLGVASTLATLAAAGALLVGVALATHLHQYVSLEQDLRPGIVGVALLLLLQLAYVPNAVVWAIAFSLGPGFAFGNATVVAPTGSALGRLPALPMLAALPPGLHASMPEWLAPLVMALPYVAGVLGGLVLVRTAPTLTIEGAPLWGLACGAVSGATLGLLAAFSGGPLGDGRLAAVGPSGWQVGLVSAVEIGVAAAVSAGAANYMTLRRAAVDSSATRGAAVRHRGFGTDAAEAGHVIYLRPGTGEAGKRSSRGPSALP
jgi:hypothetical protein